MARAATILKGRLRTSESMKSGKTRAEGGRSLLSGFGKRRESREDRKIERNV